MATSPIPTTVTTALIESLNPAFLARHGLVPISVRDGRLTVAMRDCADEYAIAALRFATGMEIAPISWHGQVQLVGFEHDGPNLRSPVGPSLLNLVAARFRARHEPEFGLAPLVLLLEAGYEPVEAGRRLLTMSSLHPELHSLAQQLASGKPLAMALADGGSLPWLADAMHAWLGLGRAAEDLVISVARPGSLARMHKGAMRLGAESLILTLPLLVAARALPGGTALVLAALAVLLFSTLRLVVAKRADNDAVRADVLALVGKLAHLGLPPAVAIRSGLSRLRAITNGHLPGEVSREQLTDALLLSDIPAALLMKGELGPAASSSAAYCRDRADRQLERLGWLLRALITAAFGVALVLTIA